MLYVKMLVWMTLLMVYFGAVNHYTNTTVEQVRDVSLKQFESNDDVAREVRVSHVQRNLFYHAGYMGFFFLGFLMFCGDVKQMGKRIFGPLMLGFVFVFGLSGCAWRPYEPVDLQTIGTNEEAFLIPLTGDTTKQTTANTEEFYKKNLLYTKQVRIPQQWVQTGYATWGDNAMNGSWKPAAVLIKVDKSPVTRVWTADETSGTSNKNEAVWVMTSDQVEFSTGWTITARIQDRDNAVKFLANYPNGALTGVLDTEVRSKLQATFGLAVTDLPMEELRKNATPYIIRVEKDVIDFFAQRGITITNLGIQGGFVYKDTSIQKKLVEVFNAEQEQAIRKAATLAQQEENKRIQLAAESEALAVLTKSKAEADSIRAVADAKAYEIEKAQENKELYLELKRVELEQSKLEKWNGQFPAYFLGAGNGLDLLLNVPTKP